MAKFSSVPGRQSAYDTSRVKSDTPTARITDLYDAMKSLLSVVLFFATTFLGRPELRQQTLQFDCRPTVENF